jgi:hypothetical protein
VLREVSERVPARVEPQAEKRIKEHAFLKAITDRERASGKRRRDDMIARSMRNRLLYVFALFALPLPGQLPAPNAAGVSAGHDIFSFHDIDAANKFWNTLGGEPAELGPLKMTKFPGVLFLMRKGDPKGGTEGSTIDYIGFKVKDLKSTVDRLIAAGFTKMGAVSKNQTFVYAPDDVKVRLTEDNTLATPVVADMIHMAVPDPDAAKAWYAKWFGGPDIPGSRIAFEKANGPVTGTKGRAFDRIGLEVKNVEQKCKDLEASGIKLDTSYRKATSMNLAVCVLTDPWGTYIEISEGLAAVK